MAACVGVQGEGLSSCSSPHMPGPLSATCSDSWLKGKGHTLRCIQGQAGGTRVQTGPGARQQAVVQSMAEMGMPLSDKDV